MNHHSRVERSCACMVLNIGRIPYLSCEPFYFDMERRGLPLVDTTPRTIADAALRGEIDAGPIPLVDCPRLEGQFSYVSGFCLATIRRAVSVMLHAKVPVQELTGARVAVAEAAATGSALLKILLALKHQVQPAAYVTREEAHDAVLLIGSEGLRQRYGVWDFPQACDLGEEWYQWTGLPFVYARWMLRKTVERRDQAVLEDMLYVGLQDWADGIFRSSEARDDVLMHPRDVIEYTQGLRYFLGVPEKQAIERFSSHLKDLEAQETRR